MSSSPTPVSWSPSEQPMTGYDPVMLAQKSVLGGTAGSMLALFVVAFFVSLVHMSREVEFRVCELGSQGQPR